MKREPVLVIVGALGAVVHAGIALAVAFGVTLTQDQTAAVLGFAGAVVALVLAFAARSQVTPAAPVVPLADRLASAATAIENAAAALGRAPTVAAPPAATVPPPEPPVAPIPTTVSSAPPAPTVAAPVVAPPAG